MAKLKITLKKSVIGSNEVVRANVQALGLHKLHQSVVQEDTPDIRGKVNKVRHLLSVEELS
ncbi:MAG: 50S ribosomal protein L30 [Peptococcia bacterium]|jgi:large subunit ribosomal protein L30